MLKSAVSVSVLLHGFAFAMLYLCPEGLYIGAQKGNAGAISVEIQETSEHFALSVPKKSTNKPATIKSTRKLKLKSAGGNLSPKRSAPRKTLLTSARPKGPGFDLRNLKSNLSPAMQKFFYQLRQDIERNKRYPKKAKRFRHRGEVAVRFSVTRSGKIVNVTLENPSPFETLNRSAQKAVLSLQEKSYPLPVEVLSRQIQVILPIRYSL